MSTQTRRIATGAALAGIGALVARRLVHGLAGHCKTACGHCKPQEATT